MKAGVHKRTLAVLLAAQLAYVILRGVGLALDRRVSEYASQQGLSWASNKWLVCCGDLNHWSLPYQEG